MTDERRRELVSKWRESADRLDLYARARRSEGDTLEAADAELAATDYRIAADGLEARSESRFAACLELAGRLAQ